MRIEYMDIEEFMIGDVRYITPHISEDAELSIRATRHIIEKMAQLDDSGDSYAITAAIPPQSKSVIKLATRMGLRFVRPDMDGSHIYGKYRPC